jgi:wobble nucleotide-excising tRNase
LDKIQLQKSLREFQNKYSSIQAHCNGLGRENSDLKVKLTALEAETEKLRSFYAAPENVHLKQYSQQLSRYSS